MSDASPAAGPAPVPLKKNKYGWIGFFVFLLVASVGVAWLMIAYNLSIQLKPERFEAARKLWQEKGPRDYNMTYTTKIDASDNVSRFTVKVRGGKVQEVMMNGKPLELEDDRDPRPYHSMERLFNYIERNLELDSRPGQPKVFVTAVFDDRTGAVRQYVRRVMGTNQRIEMNVKLEELGK